MKNTINLLSIVSILIFEFCGLSAVAQEMEGNGYPISDPVVSARVAPIVKGCTTNYDKAKAIYKWLCANISYDTDYSIYDAEGCWQKRKGVCNAYSELFVTLAKECGLEAERISGLAKNSLYPKGDSGHAWVKANTEKGWILIDPTWGAGGTNGEKFIRSDNDTSWFDVDPKWMIFTHFPRNEEDQFLDVKFSESEYLQLPYVYPKIQQFGMKADTLLAYYQANPNKHFPELYSSKLEGSPQLVDIPLDNVLTVGNTYTFHLRADQPSAYFSISMETPQWLEIPEKDWEINGSDYVVTVTPSATGELVLYYFVNYDGIAFGEGLLSYEIK